MSLRTIVILGLALALGGSAAVGVSAFLGNKGPAVANSDTARIVVATTDVPRGSMITADLVKERDCPKDLVPLGAITNVEDALKRAVFSPLVKGEAVIEGKLAPKGAGRGMAALVPKGKRAFTITTPNITSGVAGFVMPGNMVDVLLTVGATSGSDDRTGGGSTTTLLQHIEILAVDQRIDAPMENKVDPNELRSVTLLVDPDQAAVLDLGQAKGSLHLSLRNPEDDQDAHTRPATLNDLRFFQDKPRESIGKGILAALGKIASQQPKAVEPPPPLPAALPPTIADEEPAPQQRTIWIFRGIQKSPAN